MNEKDSEKPGAPVFEPGALWLDTAGEPINAHGGGMLFHEGTYFWHGECRPEGPSTLNAQIGVSCYSSRDLFHWENRGVALSVVCGDDSHPLAAGCKIERPKVVFNPRTRKFVMWWHHDMKGFGHLCALAGVAVADRPEGPFELVETLKPHWRMCRNCTLFVDDDSTAYFLHATDDNATLAITRLADDFLSVAQPAVKVFPDRFMEAPCIFRRGAHYFFMGSSCTGWIPNEARSACAYSPLGGWTELGNPCLGEGAETTFGTQSTFIFPVQGIPDAFIFMADIWKPEDLADSRYVWLPIEFKDLPGQGVRPFIRWRDRWNLDFFTTQK